MLKLSLELKINVIAAGRLDITLLLGGLRRPCQAMGAFQRATGLMPMMGGLSEKLTKVPLLVPSGKKVGTGFQPADVGRVKLNLEPQDVDAQTMVGSSDNAPPGTKEGLAYVVVEIGS